MSNGVYNSIEHRATVNAMKERISLAMFFNPKLEADVGPAKSLLTNTGDPPLYKTLVMEQYLKDFFSRKLNGKTFLERMKIKNYDEIQFINRPLGLKMAVAGYGYGYFVKLRKNSYILFDTQKEITKKHCPTSLIGFLYVHHGVVGINVGLRRAGTLDAKGYESRSRDQSVSSR
ncbi:hypothetical protein L1987_39223 [Smallanthus sonchifolius]|uniref:Uncharacterized protein n=1 Tax=Smallanthus sonchifolius TaxID=185202 RepID=A0ACB9HMK9_9ASTR|nr:hypothetical protein L1987_39223 [Smallanthus sonchifolius]